MYPGILLECYSPLGNPQNPYLYGKEPPLMEDPVIATIAKKHNAAPAQVSSILLTCNVGWESAVYVVFFFLTFFQICIAFCLHRGNAVIPKSITPSRITENFKATEIRLDDEDMERLKELGHRNTRYVHVSINFKDSTEPLTFTSVVIFWPWYM